MVTTRKVAELICDLSYRDLPREVTEYSKALALSAVGAIIAGAPRNAGRIMTDYVRRGAGSPEATVFGVGLRASVEWAAMANATFAHATEYEDDSFPEAVSTYTIFPVVFALGEKLAASGRDVIEAFVAGYETQARIALACPEARRRGMLTLSLAGTLGCAAGAAKLLELDAEKTTMALSLAASQASGIAAQTGTMAHLFEMGMAARNGLTAALLAGDGFTGRADILEAPGGLFEIITGGKIPTTEEVVEAWGKPFRVMSVGIKMYPCCYHLQRIIDGVKALKQESSVRPSEIKRIQVEVNTFIPQIIRYEEPANEEEAQFSLAHAVAVAALEEDIVPRSFGDEKILDPSFRDLRKKVEMIVRKDWGWGTVGWTPRITMILEDGRTLSAEPSRAKGQPPELLGFDDVVEKYRACVGPEAKAERANASMKMLRELEGVEDVNELIRALGV